MFRTDDDGDDLFKHCSGNLKTIIYGEFISNLFWHTTFLQNHGAHFSTLISCYLEGSVYAPQEHILLEGEMDSNIYLIAYGHVEYVYDVFTSNEQGDWHRYPVDRTLKREKTSKLISRSSMMILDGECV